MLTRTTATSIKRWDPHLLHEENVVFRNPSRCNLVPSDIEKQLQKVRFQLDRLRFKEQILREEENHIQFEKRQIQKERYQLYIREQNLRVAQRSLSARDFVVRHHTLSQNNEVNFVQDISTNDDDIFHSSVAQRHAPVGRNKTCHNGNSNCNRNQISNNIGCYRNETNHKSDDNDYNRNANRNVSRTPEPPKKKPRYNTINNSNSKGADHSDNAAPNNHDKLKKKLEAKGTFGQEWKHLIPNWEETQQQLAEKFKNQKNVNASSQNKQKIEVIPLNGNKNFYYIDSETNCSICGGYETCSCGEVTKSQDNTKKNHNKKKKIEYVSIHSRFYDEIKYYNTSKAVKCVFGDKWLANKCYGWCHWCCLDKLQ